MRLHFFVFFFIGLVLLSCSQQNKNYIPSEVDPQEVKSIISADSAKQANLCEAEILTTGGAILYRNSRGLIFTNRKVEDLDLNRCTATIVPNTRMAIPDHVRPDSNGLNKIKLSTLLRLLPAEDMGARSFVKAHPKFDGRGVIIAILDTGVEMDRPMLEKTSTGKNKIIDFQDFSGEGRVKLAPVTLGEVGQFTAPNGKTYSAKAVSGGSTTTASKLLAIDFAVESGAQVINLSYGIHASSNLGQSTIDQYIDKVAQEKGILFSLSNGNEGPELLSTGTPAGAEHAISVGAFVSKETAHLNYSYVGVKSDNVWWFSSVGPRLGGGLKPTIIAPGSALSSLPQYTGGYENYRGTSMAAPEATGGLALLLSAAKQSNLPTDRVTITQAICSSAKHIPNLALVEQGHGLLNVPAAFSDTTIS